MKKIVFLIFIFVPLLVAAQRLQVKDVDGSRYLVLYAYGLPREVVKTNSEMRASVNSSGIVRRHHTTKGEEGAINSSSGTGGYAANTKISFAMAIAPYNVDASGNHISSEWDLLSWTMASGWDSSIDDETGVLYSSVTGEGESPVASSPTGCAAYKGVDGEDEPGEWRLPTQRELQVLFTVMDQAKGFMASGEINEASIEIGYYWTATEFYSAGSNWDVWCIDNRDGATFVNSRDAAYTAYARCVKDLYEDINEQ